MPRLLHFVFAILCSPAVMAFAAADDMPKDKLIPEQSIALPWIVGFGILACILIAGFKHPGRTHLD